MDKLKTFYKNNEKLIIGAFFLSIILLFWLSRAADFFNVLRAVGMMFSGFYIMAGMHYITEGNWNGYTDREKIMVSMSIFLVLSVLLVTIPETSNLLQNFGIAMDVNGQGKLGFILLGSAIAKKIQDRVETKSVDEVIEDTLLNNNENQNLS